MIHVTNTQNIFMEYVTNCIRNSINEGRKGLRIVEVPKTTADAIQLAVQLIN